MMISLTSLANFLPKKAFQFPFLRFCYGARSYANNDGIKSKSIVVRGNRLSERVRVRRARPADNARIIRFVRENSRVSWPALVYPTTTHIVLGDYVSRALAQGHSLIAEQQSSKGWTQILGLALGMVVCQWDPTMLEKWAYCIRCPRTRKLLHLTAFCLRAPGLHDKYRVHNMLQVILMVPRDTPKSAELVNMLVHNVLQRGKDVGFSVLRFDATDTGISRTFEEMNMKKEWQLDTDILPDYLKDLTEDAILPKLDPNYQPTMEVYTAFPAYQP